MLVRSSKYLEALVRRDEALTTAERALKEARRMRLDVERLTRELQESKDDYLHRLLNQHVIVHVKEPEMSIEGHIIGVYNDSIALADARVPITPAGDIERLDGTQIIARSQIGWVSELRG
jgi:hypothetical protein